MDQNKVRAEIVVSGLVQGVGFRWFVLTNAEKLGLTGYVKNLYTGDVHTVVEGEKFLIEDLYKKIQIGPSHSHVKSHSVRWTKAKNEFNRFEVRH